MVLATFVKFAVGVVISIGTIMTQCAWSSCATVIIPFRLDNESEATSMPDARRFSGAQDNMGVP